MCTAAARLHLLQAAAAVGSPARSAAAAVGSPARATAGLTSTGVNLPSAGVGCCNELLGRIPSEREEERADKWPPPQIFFTKRSLIVRSV
jgi:hypothetical protein